jgi:hypothetical protein
MIDRTMARHSRRALLAGALGGVAAATAAALGRVAPVTGAHEGPVLLGEQNQSTSVTRITRTSSGPALVADGSGPGVGCSGTTRSGIALYGVADSGQGVVGSSETGTGVEAVSSNGIALRVQRGRVRFDGISGTARIAAGHSVALVVPAAHMVRDAFVLLTPMSDLAGRGLWFSRRPDEGGFAIHLSSPPDQDVHVGWLLLG